MAMADTLSRSSAMTSWSTMTCARGERGGWGRRRHVNADPGTPRWWRSDGASTHLLAIDECAQKVRVTDARQNVVAVLEGRHNDAQRLDALRSKRGRRRHGWAAVLARA